MRMRLLTGGPPTIPLQFERERDLIHYGKIMRPWQDFADGYR